MWTSPTPVPATSSSAADPDDLYGGLPDGMAYDLAAATRGRDAFIAHLRASGCPAPEHPEAMRSVLDPLEDEVHLVEGWTLAQRDTAFSAIDAIRDALGARQ